LNCSVGVVQNDKNTSKSAKQATYTKGRQKTWGGADLQIVPKTHVKHCELLLFCFWEGFTIFRILLLVTN
jgi:hypothetical protein